MNKIVVDARGKKCPMPIIMTKKAIDSLPQGQRVEVLIDNDIAHTNLSKYISQLGYGFTSKSDKSSIEFEIGHKSISTEPQFDIEQCDVSPTLESNYVVVLSSNEMGAGDSELGEMLIRSYINVLPELDTLPKTIVLYNSGVKLAALGSDTATTLEQLHQKGVEIVCCGVCVEFYSVDINKEYIGNMFRIGNIVAASSKVIYP